MCILSMVVFLQHIHVSGCQKKDSGTKCYLLITVERPTYLPTLTSAERITTNIPQILDKCNMIVMQKKKQK